MRRPFLVGARCYLRHIEETDITEEYVRWLNDPEVSRFLESGRFPSTPEAIRAYLKRFNGSPTDLIFAIVDRKTGLHIGNVTLNRIHWVHRTGDTGLMIGRKEFWGKGYAREAWALLLEYAFDRLGLRKVVAGAAADNAASIKALRKLGFKEEGRFRKEYWSNGRYQDAVRLGLLREEFRKPT